MKLLTGVAIWMIFAVSLSAAESIGGQAPPRAARSVHLAWMAAESDTFYLEMTVQESTPGSYFMACGWNTGCADWEAKENINAGLNGGQFFLATGGDVKQKIDLRTVIEGPSDARVTEKPKPLEQFIALASSDSTALEPIPDKLVVLTFDDSSISHFTIARPLLKKLGFSATFFITEGFTFKTNKTDYMTWEQIAQLHRDGFEIGNHTRDHMGLSKKNLPRLPEQIAAINQQCEAHGIPRPTSFAYPGNALEPEALPLLKDLGFLFARRGGAPEFPYEEGRGPAYEPGRDHPLLIPSAGDARPDWTLADFQRAANQARDGKIAVLQFHGVPDGEHPWVNTPSEQFEEHMEYLHQNGFRVIAMRDLARYVDPNDVPGNPWAVINERRAALAE